MEESNREQNKTENKTLFKIKNISENNKKYIIFTICLMVFLNYASYGLPVTLFPQISKARGWSSKWTGIVLSLFQFGGFFTSCLTGKMMRFYKKDFILLISLIGICFSKMIFGCLYFIDDSISFLIISMMSRLTLGFCFSPHQTVLISLIPEIWPDSTVEKLSYYELFLNSGLISGPLIGSLIYYFIDFFWVFTINSVAHLIIGIFGIINYLRIEGISQLNEEKKPLNLKKIIENSDIMIQFFFQALFFSNITWISSGYEIYIIDSLGGSQAISSFIYCLNMIGFCISLVIVNKFYKNNASRRKYFLMGSITITIFNILFIPEIFGITDHIIGLICLGFAFFMVGVGQAMMVAFLVPEYKDLLKNVFEEEPDELLVDMASALFLSSYSLAGFTNTIIGGVTIDAVGYKWTVIIYTVVLIIYFWIYWIKQLVSTKRNYQKMIDI